MIASTHHQNVIKTVFDSFKDNNEDILIVSKEGHTIVTNKKLLCFYSSEISKILVDISKVNEKDIVTMLVDAEFTSILVLFDLLKFGVTYDAEKDALEKVVDAAKTLGINLCNLSSFTKENNYSFLLEETTDFMNSLCDEVENKKIEYENIVKERLEGNKNEIDAERFALTKSAITKEFLEGSLCEICGKYFKSDKNMKIHMQFHSNFKCKTCNKEFFIESLLLVHEKNHHMGQKDEKYINCNKTKYHSDHANFLPYMSQPVHV